MEVCEITARPEAARSLRTADVAGLREVHVTLQYGEADLELAAEAAGVELGAAERDSMLLRLDDAIADIVREGIRSALRERIGQEVGRLVAGHACSEDE